MAMGQLVSHHLVEAIGRMPGAGYAVAGPVSRLEPATALMAGQSSARGLRGRPRFLTTGRMPASRTLWPDELVRARDGVPLHPARLARGEGRESATDLGRIGRA